MLRAQRLIVPLCLLAAAPLSGAPEATAPVAAARLTGPLADFGPHMAIATHRRLETMETELDEDLTDLLGSAHIVEAWEPEGEEAFSDDAGTLLWMRDFTPVFVQAPSGEVEAVRYLSRNGLRVSYHLADREQLFVPFPGSGKEGVWLPSPVLPIVHENGNLVSTGRWVLLSETIFEENAQEDDDAALIEAGYLPRSPEEVLSILELGLHVPRERIIVLPRLPQEGTGHVDLFVLALDEDTVMVPRVDRAVIAELRHVDERELGEETATFLDVAAQEIAQRGLEVLRWPMLPPRLLPAIDDAASRDAVFLSPANALLVDGPGGRQALVPTFHDRFVVGRFRDLQRRYDERWRRAFVARGWPTRAAEASTLARYLGLFRCVTAPIPAALAPPAL